MLDWRVGDEVAERTGDVVVGVKVRLRFAVEVTNELRARNFSLAVPNAKTFELTPVG